MADRLRQRCERSRVPNGFFPHHGSVSKSLREELEKRLKKGDLPTTVVASTTLELGIGIGSVKSVAQIGARVPSPHFGNGLGAAVATRALPKSCVYR
jgi:ATP-dependent helicase Lhr and Lhr-like helicase